jgi:hypothetical protein
MFTSLCVSLTSKSSDQALAIGDHHGDPTMGLVTADEVWFITAGEGLQCYSRASGLLTFFRRGHSPLAAPGSAAAWNVHDARLEGERVVRVLIDPWSEFASVWRVDLRDASVAKLSDGPFLSREPYRDNVEF